MKALHMVTLLLIIISGGCKSGSDDRSFVASEAFSSSAGSCDKRARGAAADLHKQEYGLDTVNFANSRFLGQHKFGLTTHAIYLVDNTDEVDGASVLLAFEVKAGGKCSYIPFIADDQDSIDDGDSDQERSYAVLSY